MSGVFSLNGMNLPDSIRAPLAQHLARIERAEDLHALERAQERAEGFVEGVEAARALTAASIEALFIAVDAAATERRQGLTA